MGLVDDKIEIKLYTNIKYWEKLKYNIFKQENVKGILQVPRGTKLDVKIKDLPKNSGQKVKVRCDLCQKEYNITYQTYNKYVHDNNTYYCRICAAKLFRSKENNGNWNSNLTNEERENKRNTLKNTEWVKKCLKNANYKSQISQKYSHDLQVHHLYDWANHKEQRYNLENGIVLTKKEHKAFHNWQRIKYPKQPCIKKHFEEWVGYFINTSIQHNITISSARKIYCIEENKVYDSARALAKKWNMKDNSHIYDVCNHKVRYKKKKCTRKDGSSYISNYKTTAKTIKNKHLIWYDKYIAMEKSTSRKAL